MPTWRSSHSRKPAAGVLCVAIALAVAGSVTSGCRRPFLGVCGNGIVDPGTAEECDDGGTIDGDGCSSTCRLEPATCGDGVCDLGGSETCANCVLDCAADPGCAGACGDGVIDTGELCDGTELDGEDCLSQGFPGGVLACNAACDGFDVSGCDQVGSCGDGTVDAGEDCDDSGESATCDADCTTALCGDGTINAMAGEGCDDGDGSGGDGCSAACAVEGGWMCAGEPSVCDPDCGDGTIEGGEECDDGNTANGDGCSSACTTEPGFVCNGMPSVCIGVPTFLGDLVITEIMPDPTVVNDADGEWFEVYNPTAAALELMGIVFQDDGSDAFTVGSSLIVPAGGRVVFGNNAVMATNGGLVVDYEYSGMWIANSDDEIEIFAGTTSIDRVAYTSVTFPTGVGAAMSLSAAATDASSNDFGTNWCPAMSPYGGGDLGTPGSPNPTC